MAARNAEPRRRGRRPGVSKAQTRDAVFAAVKARLNVQTNGRRECRETVATLAADVGCCEKTVRLRLNDLVAAGLLVKVRSVYDGKDGAAWNGRLRLSVPKGVRRLPRLHPASSRAAITAREPEPRTSTELLRSSRACAREGGLSRGSSGVPHQRFAVPATVGRRKGREAAGPRCWRRADRAFTAACRACGYDPKRLTKRERGRVNAMLRELREIYPGLDHRRLADLVKLRGDAYRLRYCRRPTPQAVTGNWLNLYVRSVERDLWRTWAWDDAGRPEIPEPPVASREVALANLHGILASLGAAA